MFSDKFPLMFSIMSFIPIVMFFVVGAFIIMVFMKVFKQWNSDNKSPRIAVPATVVAKRDSLSHRHHHHHSSAHHHSTTSHTYYATFQMENGERMELLIPVTEFGLLLEGDRGMLTFQGRRFVSFDRIHSGDGWRQEATEQDEPPAWTTGG